MARVLVTGAGSYIARCLMERLVALGFSVRGFDAAPVEDPVEDVEYFSGDITRAGLLSDMVRGTDHIFHLFRASSGAASGRSKGGVTFALALTIKLLTLAENLDVKSFVYLLYVCQDLRSTVIRCSDAEVPANIPGVSVMRAERSSEIISSVPLMLTGRLMVAVLDSPGLTAFSLLTTSCIAAATIGLLTFI